jgi:hypothetical protein
LKREKPRLFPFFLSPQHEIRSLPFVQGHPRNVAALSSLPFALVHLRDVVAFELQSFALNYLPKKLVQSSRLERVGFVLSELRHVLVPIILPPVYPISPLALAAEYANLT